MIKMKKEIQHESTYETIDPDGDLLLCAQGFTFQVRSTAVACYVLPGVRFLPVEETTGKKRLALDNTPALPLQAILLIIHNQHREISHQDIDQKLLYNILVMANRFYMGTTFLAPVAREWFEHVYLQHLFNPTPESFARQLRICYEMGQEQTLRSVMVAIIKDSDAETLDEYCNLKALSSLTFLGTTPATSSTSNTPSKTEQLTVSLLSFPDQVQACRKDVMNRLVAIVDGCVVKLTKDSNPTIKTSAILGTLQRRLSSVNWVQGGSADVEYIDYSPCALHEQIVLTRKYVKEMLEDPGGPFAREDCDPFFGLELHLDGMVEYYVCKIELGREFETNVKCLGLDGRGHC